ncbi:MAG TPA: hypothetical protein VHR42_07845, partial [Clostridia bacterium]|nr:hypothetical protein [Clostridia bacterium]
PAVYLLARSFCNAARGSIDAAKIEEFLGGAQKQRSMESAELSGFGVMLRAALIEGAARACVMNLEDQERKILLSDAVKTLNFLTTFDFSEIIERQSGIERIMTEDPAGIYTRMDERSRGVYRDMIAKIARKRKMSETDVAAKTVEMARMGKTSRERHVGYYILERELDRPKSTRRGKIYLFLLWSVPAILGILLGLAFRKVWLPFLVYLPLWEIVRPIIEYETMKGVPATYLPRLENDGVVPEDAPTLVVISTLLSSPQKIEEFVKKLEQFYYSNGWGAILFGLLADLKESKLPEQPEDKAIKTAAIKAIRKLNERLGPHFCIFIRSRRLSRTQGKFSGWERKRGAIIELIRYMKGISTSITTVEGDARMLHSIKYLITLDADTGLLIDTASEMVSVAMHPLNEPEIAEGENKVGRGYGILSPKISIDLESAGRTPFSRVMAGCGGVTAYDNAAGNAYQDLFGEGIYAGKGLINVDAFYSVLDHALPENRILSHDILEGCYMRVGFVSDVEMTDGFPPKPAPWFDRLHRWIRGDWQNISYISGRIKTAGGTVKIPFGNLSRFKLADNLRRSVTPVASVLGVAFSAFTGLKLSLTLILIAFLSIAGPGLWSAALAVARGGFSMLSRKYHCKVLPQAVNSVYQGILLYLFLPYHALIAADGVIRALWRQMSGRKMLEWVTAAENEARVGGAAENLRRFWVCTVTGVVFLAAAVSPLARVAGAFWIITPFVAWMSGRPMSQSSAGLTDDDKEKLRSYTAAMWRYYEDYVGEKDHFLPPDNVQEAPVHVVAHRTSPTNIGLYLLSTLAARDLRLIDSEILLERVTATLSTIEKLGKWKGHLYNWYDTVTLEPLKPRYVSTVDSGNLLCCLTALSEGLKEYAYLGPASELTNRIQKLIDDVDLGVLFNKRRKLFHIGYDIEKDCLSEIYYDLLMSEARMTSYYAVARRIAPKRHWGALGRTLTRQGGYTGPISWTGTMFEYLMPH